MEHSPKLQRAARRYLLRLVYEQGAEEAARVLCDLAVEIQLIAELEAGASVSQWRHTEGGKRSPSDAKPRA